jgi:hypothetical protein
MEFKMGMEADIKISKFMRGLGALLCILIIYMLALNVLILRNHLPLDVILQIALLVIIFGPVCYLGYIPGKFLDILPKFLVKAIKLDFSSKN